MIRLGGQVQMAVGVHQQLPINLKKGAKPSKILKELTETIQANVLTPLQAIITTDDVFTSIGKTFRGGDGGTIKIISATRDENGQVKVKFEVQAPTDVIPAAGGGAGNAAGAVNRPAANIQIVPAIPLQPALPPQGFQAVPACPLRADYTAASSSSSSHSSSPFWQQHLCAPRLWQPLALLAALYALCSNTVPSMLTRRALPLLAPCPRLDLPRRCAP